MYRVTFFELKSPKDNSGKRTTMFKAVIEMPRNYNYFDEIAYELRMKGFLVYQKPIILEGKQYDFTYHDSLEDAQDFCKSLGYEISAYAPQDATWKGSMFRVK